MLDSNQHEIAESQFERNQRREAEVEDALKQERARHEAAVNNMYRLRALRLAQDAKSIGGAVSSPDSRNSMADNRLDSSDGGHAH
jgi:hypothetical protein